MPRRPHISVEVLRERWQESPFHGGMVGILSVTLATALVAVACAVIALVVTLVY